MFKSHAICLKKSPFTAYGWYWSSYRMNDAFVVFKHRHVYVTFFLFFDTIFLNPFYLTKEWKHDFHNNFKHSPIIFNYRSSFIKGAVFQSPFRSVLYWKIWISPLFVCCYIFTKKRWFRCISKLHNGRYESKLVFWNSRFTAPRVLQTSAFVSNTFEHLDICPLMQQMNIRIYSSDEKSWLPSTCLVILL